jgi:hypothetical protein
MLRSMKVMNSRLMPRSSEKGSFTWPTLAVPMGPSRVNPMKTSVNLSMAKSYSSLVSRCRHRIP